MRYAFLLLLSAVTLLGQGFGDNSAPFLMSTSPLRRGLVGYWRLEESSGTRYDCSKNGYHLTSNNSVAQGAGKQQFCAKFAKASSQYLSIASNTTLGLANGFTLTAWINMTNIGSGNVPIILSKYRPTSGNFGYELLVTGSANNAGVASVTIATNATTGVFTVSASTFGNLATNDWYFIAATYDKVNLKISVNGGTQDSGACAFSVNLNSENFLIGQRADLNSVLYFDGFIDEVGIWNRALPNSGSADSIAALYNSTRGTHFPWAHP